MPEDAVIAVQPHIEELEGRGTDVAVPKGEPFAVQVLLELAEHEITGGLAHRHHVGVVDDRRHHWGAGVDPRRALAIAQKDWGQACPGEGGPQAEAAMLSLQK